MNERESPFRHPPIEYGADGLPVDWVGAQPDDRCGRCGHPMTWHRLDDATNLDPTDPETPFRCIGYDCEKPGPPVGDCTCPDWVWP